MRLSSLEFVRKVDEGISLYKDLNGRLTLVVEYDGEKWFSQLTKITPEIDKAHAYYVIRNYGTVLASIPPQIYKYCLLAHPHAHEEFPDKCDCGKQPVLMKLAKCEDYFVLCQGCNKSTLIQKTIQRALAEWATSKFSHNVLCGLEDDKKIFDKLVLSEEGWLQQYERM